MAAIPTKTSVLDGRPGRRGRRLVEQPECEAQHAHPVAGEAVVRRANPAAPLAIERLDRALDPHAGRHLQQPLDRALRKRHV